jgi:hypothetical protein
VGSRRFFRGLLHDLVAHTRYEAELSKPLATGGSERANLEAAARKGSRKAREKLESGPEPPEELEYLYEWFHEVAGGCAGEPMTWRDIEAWSALTGNKPDPCEAAALLTLDREVRDAMKPDKEA